MQILEKLIATVNNDTKSYDYKITLNTSLTNKFHKQLYETTVLKPLILEDIDRENIASSFASSLTIITSFCKTFITKWQQKEPQKLKSI